jgi:hypothetical protein
MSLRVVPCVALASLALPAVLRAQAMTEYAVQSSGSAVAGSSGYSFAGCELDSSLASCLNHSYPRTTLCVAVVAGLLIIGWLWGRFR